ncbi:MAG: phosphoribosylanthranilate isomerase [Actinomycetota bacterium]|nr:phosphoribosylanthranilate isomerase [Actinomycetota bacterium]
MKVKICGITNLEDAREAVRLGAWAIGLVHHEESPRSCDPATAVEIGAELRRRCEVVGVFVNPKLDQVEAAAADEGLSIVQLNGEEGPSFCTEVARRTGAKVIKTIHVSSAADVRGADAFRTDFHMFDTRRGDLWGGTGETFDWDLLAGRRSKVPAILAGGLRPDNVAAAAEAAHPFAVDVASGVEAEPGRKDHELLASFLEAARAATPAPAP